LGFFWLSKVYNLSTGILANKNCLQKINARVLSMCFDSSGFNLWVGDDKGGLTTFHFDIFTLKLSKTRKVANNPGYSVTSVAYKNLNMKESYLLVNAMPNYLLLYKISNEDNTVTLSKRVAIKQANNQIRSVFCPKMGNTKQQSKCFVCTGSEDTGLYIYDMNNQESPIVNKLQRHTSPVLDVSFNYDQSLLASADQAGCVVVWMTNNQL
jgi:WD40 repeat protein